MRSRNIIIAALFCGILPYACAEDWYAPPAPVSGMNKAAPAPPEPVPPPPERARAVICVDPGHPNSFNDGFTPVNGTNETHINWLVALKLQAILKGKGFDVVMTKSSERQYVENKERALLCNGSGAALSVHLHCESTPGSGFALYYPDRQGVYEYKDDPDNGFKGPSAGVMADSKALADTIEKGMLVKLAGALPSRGVLGDSRSQVGSTQGALTFSIFSRIPTLTIEMAVLTNTHDAAFIKADEGQEKMAQAIAAGILLYRAP